MRNVAYFIIGFYIVNFLFGYAALRDIGKEKQTALCERIFTMPNFALMTIFNGEGNACLDLGIYPKAHL